MSILKILKRLNPITRIFAIFDLMKDVDLVATVIWNFRFFPYSVARKLPIYLGYNVDIVGFKDNKQLGGGYYVEYQ